MARSGEGREWRSGAQRNTETHRHTRVGTGKAMRQRQHERRRGRMGCRGQSRAGQGRGGEGKASLFGIADAYLEPLKQIDFAARH